MIRRELARKLLPLWIALLVGSFSALVIVAWLINLGFIVFNVYLSSAMIISAVVVGSGIEICFLILANREAPSETYPSILGSIYILPVALGMSGRLVAFAGILSIIIYAGLLIRISWLTYDIQWRQSRRTKR